MRIETREQLQAIRKEAKAKGSGNGRGMSIKKEHNSYAPFFVC